MNRMLDLLKKPGALAWIAAAIQSVGLFSYLYRANVAVGSTLELDYGEGTVLWQAQNLAHISKAVHPLGTYPFILFNYPPVFHSAALALSALMPSLLSAGRLISILSMIGICALLAVTVWRVSNRSLRAPCAAVAALFPLHLPTADWSLLMRVDTIGILFVWLGLLLFFSARRRPWLAYLAFLSFTVALYSKQTLIAAPLACMICLFVESPRRAIRVLSLFALGGFVILAVLAGFTHGEFVRHLFTYNVSPAAVRHGEWLAAELLRRSAVLVLLAVAGVPVILGRIAAGPRNISSYARSFRDGLLQSDRSRTEIVSLLYVGTSLLAGISILKVGANINYLIEPLLACSLLAALFVETILADDRRSASVVASWKWIAVCASALVALTTLHATAGFSGVNAVNRDSTRNHDQMLARVRALPGDVYSEEMTLLLETGKEVPGEPSSVTFLSMVHLWNERPLVECFERAQFSAIVVNTSIDNKEHFSPAVRSAILREYVLSERTGPYLVYVPRRANTESTTEEMQGEL